MKNTQTRVANPWHSLPSREPFVLAGDRLQIEAFNRTAKREHQVDLTLRPEPFLGNPEAPVLLLGLNPGWSREDRAWHRRRDFSELCCRNLAHSTSSYPFYLLNPQLDAPGSHWWRRRLRSVIEIVGLECTARSLMCVEYFPYHTNSFSSRTPLVDSQHYGFALVRRAMTRRAEILLMRSTRRWLEAVPELDSYKHRHELRSVQNVSISPRNCPKGFMRLVSALRASDPVC